MELHKKELLVEWKDISLFYNEHFSPVSLCGCKKKGIVAFIEALHIKLYESCFALALTWFRGLNAAE